MDPSRPISDDTPVAPEDDPAEAIVARVLERYDIEGESAIEAAARAHPEQAETIRRRCAALRRLGLVSHRGETHGPLDTPRTFGRYRILETLGAGGMGVVYLALDERLGRKVALKASGPRISTSARARARFEREVRAAAQLDHPHIVPIFDVGEEHGTPYYTMQYVEGATLASIIGALVREGRSIADLSGADIQRLTRSDADATRAPQGERADSGRFGTSYVESVCRIVLDVAEALAYAHDHGVIHRDVKPANILLDRDGRAVLFDLGLAHLDDEPALTVSGDFAGTPQYVSPEQIAAKPSEIDRRTDVYSLGVTFYELLTLRTPFTGRNTQAILRQVQVKEPPLLRRHNPAVPRDLETICLTAMEKDRERRYASAREMADDLRRFLEFQPVRARGIGALRRGSRFVRRNPALGAALALGTLVIVFAPIGLLVANALIREQRDRAEAAARDARARAVETAQVSEFMVDLFREPERSGAAADAITAREVLDRGAERIETALGAQPLVQAAFMETLGRAYANLGISDRALRLFDRALAIRTRELGEGHADVARLLYSLASVHFSVGSDVIAKALCRRSQAAYERAGLAGHPDAAACALLSGEIAVRGREFERARDEYARALAIQRAALERDAPAVADTLHRLAMLELERPSDSADLERAEVLFQESLTIRRGAWEPSLADVAASLSGLGRLHARRGDVPRARENLEEALEIDLGVHGSTHPIVGALVRDLLALDPIDDPAPDAAERRARWLQLSAENERSAGDLDAAERVYHEAIDALQGALGDAHPDVALARVGLARVLAARDRCDLALGELAHATPILDNGARADARALDELSLAEDALARCCLAAARPSEAAHHLALSLDFTTRARALDAHGARDSGVSAARAQFDARFQTGISALQSGRYGEAIDAFEACLELEPRNPTPAYNIACAHSLLGNVDEALVWLERAVNLGFGQRSTALNNAAKDTDLANVRRDPRFAAAIERMAVMRAAAEAYASRAAVYVPKVVTGAEMWPLLIVLHADGSTKDAVVSGPWRTVADALGLVLVAPSGRTPTGTDPEQGMSWSVEPERENEAALDDARRVSDALRALRVEHKIDRAQIYLAGDGQGGNVAFRIAARVPGLYRGVFVRGASIDPERGRERTVGAPLRGLRVVVDVERGRPIVGLEPSTDLDAWARALETRIERLGGSATIEIGPPSAEPLGSESARLTAAVRQILAR